METILEGIGTTVRIGPAHPTVLIGERINPTGRQRLAEEFLAGDVDVVREEASGQVEAGADVIDINVGAAGVDEVTVLPRAIEAAQEAVGVPLSIDTSNHEALEAALKVYQGKPLVNSVNGEEKNLERVLPLVAEHGTAVVGLTMDEDGIPDDPGRRLEIAEKIVERAETFGIPRRDILIDCVALAVSASPHAAMTTLEAIDLVKAELNTNMTLGHSNISYGLPDRPTIDRAFLAMAVRGGVNAPIVDAAEVKESILAADVLLGRDDYAMRYIQCYRERQEKEQGER